MKTDTNLELSTETFTTIGGKIVELVSDFDNLKLFKSKDDLFTYIVIDNSVLWVINKDHNVYENFLG